MIDERGDVIGHDTDVDGPIDVGRAPVMLSVAVGVLLVTAWEIYDGFRRARRADARAAGIGEPRQAVR